LPAPSMKEAMPHDAQRSAPGSRTHEPIEGYAKFCKLVLVLSCKNWSTIQVREPGRFAGHPKAVLSLWMGRE
jgi:hypothetical protein